MTVFRKALVFATRNHKVDKLLVQYQDDKEVMERMWDLKQRYPGNFWDDLSLFFGNGLVSFHVADYTLIPSIFEPSGIVQHVTECDGIRPKDSKICCIISKIKNTWVMGR